MQKRIRGFTLIELLVVIAIIGILAAMLFPVFARARESARKTQCLSNVKNIAMALQMYLADYDRFPNSEQDGEWGRWLTENIAGASWDGACATPHRINRTNPYLRWPVVLDEYIKNREVWSCPSVRVVQHPSRIIPQYTSVWWRYVADNMREDLNPCQTGSWYPPGWGGAVTDSVVQTSDVASQSGVFTQALGVTLQRSAGLSTSAVDDPTKWLVVGDNQGGLDIRTMFTTIFASACCWGVANDDCSCTGTALKFYSDPSSRRQYAPHMGGVNLGFADGHAKWWSAEAALNAAGSCCGLLNGDGSYAACVPATGIHGTCGDYFG